MVYSSALHYSNLGIIICIKLPYCVSAIYFMPSFILYKKHLEEEYKGADVVCTVAVEGFHSSHFSMY